MIVIDRNHHVDAAARAAHEVNRAYCIALGDTSQPSWDEAPEWQRESAKKGVQGAQRAKDALFVCTTRAMGHAFGMKLVPTGGTHVP